MTKTKSVMMAAALLGALAAGSAQAHVSVSVGIAVPGVSAVIGAPVYAEPAPVYMAPPPPVYMAPPVVYQPAPVVYAPPVYVRRAWAPAPVYYGPPAYGYYNGHRHHHDGDDHYRGRDRDWR